MLCCAVLCQTKRRGETAASVAEAEAAAAAPARDSRVLIGTVLTVLYRGGGAPMDGHDPFGRAWMASENVGDGRDASWARGVIDVWCVVCGVWHVVCGIWYVVNGTWCVVDVRYAWEHAVGLGVASVVVWATAGWLLGAFGHQQLTAMC